MTPPRIVAAGDGALLVEYENRIDPGVNARAVSLAAHLRQRAITGVYDLVPAFRTLTVYFDPLRTDVDAIAAAIHAHADAPSTEAPTDADTIEIPVCYDPDFGLDLAVVGQRSGLAVADVVAMHTAVTYRVYMLGFMPGFAYLGSVDQRIATPRRATPRTRVAAGSVGIAGEQTGIYPTSTPGGWNIVGRTPVSMLAPESSSPSLLRPGLQVRFRAIDRPTFEAWPTGKADA